MYLCDAVPSGEYLIETTDTEDADTDAFLSSLGFRRGGMVCVLSMREKGMIIIVEGARYAIDYRLAEKIEVKKI